MNASFKRVLVVFVLFLTNCARCDPQEEERAILTQLYHSTNGQYWLRSDNWLSNNVSACFWAGIACLNSRVVQLILPSNQLTGTLPESIGNLLMLDVINLEGNHLSGTIPESIKNLSMLQRLWLGGNQLSGIIPTWINLPNLFYIYLSSNQFSGTIPDFSGVPRLQRLLLNTNQLKGTIPASLAANADLEIIFLAGNKLTGSIPPELGQLKKIQELHLSRNELSGTIPESIYQTNLTYFGAAHNELSGTISDKINHLQNLMAFDLAYNRLSGTIPESVGELKSLVRFEVIGNSLTGTIPKSVTQLTTMTQFLIADNQISGTIPDDIGNMVGLTHFLASRNRLSGTLPNSITNLRKLLWLQAENNELTGTIPNDIGRLTMLQQLLLSVNRLSGTIPASVGQLTGLQVFNAYRNQLEGPIPETIGNLKLLQTLNLVINNLTGTLPPSIARMSSLVTFAVSHNRISGVIPESFGTFASIRSLLLNNNNLIGTIPRALGRNRRLGDLVLGGNRFSGPLPSFESPNFLPAELVFFTVNDNQLTGTVPMTYRLMTRLRSINLSNNQLTGTVLNMFDYMDTIAEVDFSNNNFIGTIPPTLTTRGLLRILKLENNGFSGTIPESINQLISLNMAQFDNNGFSGTLPLTLSRLFRLQELHLANNTFTGTIPPELFDLPLKVLDLSNNDLNGTIANGIATMQTLMKLDLSSNWFSGTLPAMSSMRALQQIHVRDNLLRGCLALPSTFTEGSNQCSIDGNAFCCALEEFNCYDAYCPAKSTLFVHSGATSSLSTLHNVAAFHNLIVEPNAKLVVRNKDALILDCMQFEGEMVFDMTESEAESPVFSITTTCGGSQIDSLMKISSEGRSCHSSSIRTVGKTITVMMSCPTETSIALVVGLTVPLGTLLIAATILLIVIVRARKKREEQLKSRVEMLTLSSSHVKNNSAPPEEFTFKLPDDLPIKLSKTSFKFGTKGNLLIVDKVVRDSFTVSLRKSKVISVGSLYDKLVQHRTVVQIRPIISPKYNLIATPQVFEVPDGGSTEVELVLTMKMTTKCQVSLWIELPEEEIYSLIEFDAASEHSPWIDVDEVQVEGDAIGEGGFGAVYKAMYRGQRVAFKTLKMQDLGEEITREFEQEVRMMMNLHHKSIVQFIGASRVTGKRAILTEFITNGDLKHLLQKQQLDMKFKLKLALDIAEALQFLHLNNILHRDIKPENALVVSTSKDAIVNVKLADFGTARSVSDSVTSKFTKGVGTPIYMAVEILKNENYARSADIFSFGVLLWAIITQDEPYKEFKYSWDVAEFVLQGKRMTVPQDCPHQISKLISQCWAQEPNDRPLIGEVVRTIETVYLSTK